MVLTFCATRPAKSRFKVSVNGIELSELAEVVLAGFRDGGLSELAKDPKAAMEQALRTARRAHSVSVPDHFVMIGRLLAAVGGLVMSHADDVDPTALALRCLSRARPS